MVPEVPEADWVHCFGSEARQIVLEMEAANLTVARKHRQTGNSQGQTPSTGTAPSDLLPPTRPNHPPLPITPSDHEPVHG
jgi:hypothetical protein